MNWNNSLSKREKLHFLLCLRCLTLLFLYFFLPSEKVLQTYPQWAHGLILLEKSYQEFIHNFIFPFKLFNKNQIKIIALYSKVYHRSAWVTLLSLTDWSSSRALTRLWSTSLLWLRTIPAAVQISKTASILYCCHCSSVGRLRTDASSVQQPRSWEKKEHTTLLPLRTERCSFTFTRYGKCSCLSDRLIKGGSSNKSSNKVKKTIKFKILAIKIKEVVRDFQ